MSRHASRHAQRTRSSSNGKDRYGGCDGGGCDSGNVLEEEGSGGHGRRCHEETMGSSLTPDEAAFRSTLIGAVSDLKRDLLSMRSDIQALKVAGSNKTSNMQAIDYCFLFVRLMGRADELVKSLLEGLLECQVHYYIVVKRGFISSLKVKVAKADAPTVITKGWLKGCL